MYVCMYVCMYVMYVCLADWQALKHKQNDPPTSAHTTGSRSPCMRPRSDPPNFGPIERGEKQTNNID